jgi:hypothetical protein
MRAWPFDIGKELEYASSRAGPWNPVPFITLPQSNSGDTLSILKKILCRLGKRAIVKWDSVKKLEVLRGSEKKLTFAGDWNEHELFEWLRRSMIARCELLTPDLFAILGERTEPIIHFFIDPKKKVDEFLAFVQELPEAQYTYSTYDPNDPFVKKLHAKSLKLPVTVWYHPKSERFVLYDGAFRPQELAEWITIAGKLAVKQNTWVVVWLVAGLAVIVGAIILFNRCRRIKKSAFFGSAGAGKRKGFM